MYVQFTMYSVHCSLLILFIPHASKSITAKQKILTIKRKISIIKCVQKLNFTPTFKQSLVVYIINIKI